MIPPKTDPTAATNTPAELPADRLIALFDATWKVLENLPDPVRNAPSYQQALAALASLEEPLRALVNDLDEGGLTETDDADGQRPTEADRLWKEDAAARARDMNRILREVA